MSRTRWGLAAVVLLMLSLGTVSLTWAGTASPATAKAQQVDTPAPATQHEFSLKAAIIQRLPEPATAVLLILGVLLISGSPLKPHHRRKTATVEASTAHNE